VPAFYIPSFALRCAWPRPFFPGSESAVERAHAVDRAVDAVDEALAFVVGEAKFPHSDRSADDHAEAGANWNGTGDDRAAASSKFTAASFSWSGSTFL